MALIPCRECSREISDTAPTCPHCGVTALIQCYECGKEISGEAPACPHCGITTLQVQRKRDADKEAAKRKRDADKEAAKRKAAAEKQAQLAAAKRKAAAEKQARLEAAKQARLEAAKRNWNRHKRLYLSGIIALVLVLGVGATYQVRMRAAEAQAVEMAEAQRRADEEAAEAQAVAAAEARRRAAAEAAEAAEAQAVAAAEARRRAAAEAAEAAEAQAVEAAEAQRRAAAEAAEAQRVVRVSVLATVSYHPNGQVRERGGWYDTGQRHGPYEYYLENGQLVSKGNYNKGARCGEWLAVRVSVTYDPCPPDLEGGN